MTTAALMRLLPCATGVTDADEEKSGENTIDERYFPRSMIDLSKLFRRTVANTSRGAPLLTFGRGSREKCDVTLIEQMDRDNNMTPFIVSRHHFTIARRSSSQYYIRDEDTANGTWLRHDSADVADVRPLLPKRWYALRDGDVISLGYSRPLSRGDGEAARASPRPFLYAFRLMKSRCYACRDHIESEAISLCGARDHTLCEECFIASATSQMRSCSNLEELTLVSYYAPRCELCRNERHPEFMTKDVGAYRDRLLRDAFARAGHGDRSAVEFLRRKNGLVANLAERRGDARARASHVRSLRATELDIRKSELREICTLRCPNPDCSREFAEHVGCAALCCRSYDEEQYEDDPSVYIGCGHHFCGFCLRDFGSTDDDGERCHAHVPHCSRNPTSENAPATRDVFCSAENFRRAHERRKRKLCDERIAELPEQMRNELHDYKRRLVTVDAP
ncbi:hypothetical protein CYMTET_15145 [Cymbomonas tetramitiformis]|uniref:FHA domain-containing protein n=1 Tax=Cymbomonas tetramitiformis TaxID=36881 RepID=A0AAE0GF45_9CHLO|nr:hypothetical protein CYMTET_15145 [Cymbomonas tetramitiformis]|eukprot:gene18809-22472_t